MRLTRGRFAALDPQEGHRLGAGLFRPSPVDDPCGRVFTDPPFLFPKSAPIAHVRTELPAMSGVSA